MGKLLLKLNSNTDCNFLLANDQTLLRTTEQIIFSASKQLCHETVASKRK